MENQRIIVVIFSFLISVKGRPLYKLIKSYVLSKTLKNGSVKFWFAKFRSDDFLFRDEKSSVRLIQQKKVFLSICWDYKGIVFFTLLPPNRMINSDVYIEQLTKLSKAVKGKRPTLTNRKRTVFHHDNARSHTSLATWQK